MLHPTGMHAQGAASLPGRQNASCATLTGRFTLPALRVVMLGFLVLGVMGSGRAGEPVDPAYLKVVSERAEKIVQSLGIDDPTSAARVTDVIAQQYVDLGRIHDARDAAIAAVRAQTGEDPRGSEERVAAARNEADAAIYRLHAAYLARLSVELTPEQLEGVKDGMTYGVARGTYDVYLKMCPDLSGEQQKRIKAWLVEARELAMDQGSAREKHGVFGKYKGRINNYLSAAGYDLKEAEKNLFK